MAEFIPWGLYAAGIAAQLVYLQELPMIFHRRRLGLAPGFASLALWPCLALGFSLFAWPFVAAGSIDWRRAPSVWGLMLMCLGAAAIAVAMRYLVQFVAGAKMNALDRDEDAADLAVLWRRYTAASAVFAILIPVAAWWTLGQAGQDWLSGERHYY